MDGHGTDILDLTLLERSVKELVPGGPRLPTKETAEVVDQLREAADTSIDLVLDVMRLDPGEADAVRTRAAAGDVLIVDRLGWAKATGQSLTAMVGTAMSDDVRAAMEAGRIPNTLEMAAVLSVLSTRVLGQFDPFGGGPHPDGAGRLLLVAPSIAQTEATLSVTPRDFRLWVALHESTHRVQFAAAPWLRDHLSSLISELLGDDPAFSGLTGLKPLIRSIPEIVRGETRLVDVVTGPEKRAVLDQVMALMSFLEGHADVVMDAVGPSVIPDLARIRQRFEARRDDGIGPGGAISRLLGMDSKLQQYREGAVFVRSVVRSIGHEGLATAFTSPDMLPTVREIARPDDWVARVHAARESEGSDDTAGAAAEEAVRP
ncbi:zinc-dependent metalloprotease [Brevibacterium jeotgali]|uniref:Putative hydrolase/uncharacterized protein, coenzyme F420 biosynthesis associated n=1 Tax=Brevibacterium jeotgali TaxID=1262550 RepID=A0A2H1L0Z3_9MICO|nr:zinc-dependent metalloprotease [Brevibacterium jeotgali]TWC02071.1 putative hydrolase/coenzyme F420 biosynthesis associated uncharacterized protein [Brevibacterium jeotgali]SMY10578.1 putative hydrolase/uncharacterized protein, coenzyme F420 biosynthesis associated [Brevibacterium jeotgali]